MSRFPRGRRRLTGFYGPVLVALVLLLVVGYLLVGLVAEVSEDGTVEEPGWPPAVTAGA